MICTSSPSGVQSPPSCCQLSPGPFQSRRGWGGENIVPSFAVSPRTEARRRRTGEGQGWQGAGFHLVLDLLVIFNRTNLAAVAIRLMRCGPSGTPPASRAKAASPLPSNETAGRFLVPLQLLEGNRHCAEHAALKPWTDPLHRICGASRGSLQPREGASWAGSKRQRRHPPPLRV